MHKMGRIAFAPTFEKCNISFAPQGYISFAPKNKKNYLCHFAEDVQDVFLDGTFKYCSKYFFQMYTMHGCKNGNYVHLLYCYMHCYQEKVKYATNRCGFYYFSFVNRETLH